MLTTIQCEIVQSIQEYSLLSHLCEIVQNVQEDSISDKVWPFNQKKKGNRCWNQTLLKINHKLS